MNRTAKIFVSIILFTLLVAPQARAAHVVERIIARVNSEIITQTQFEKEKAKLREELSQQFSGPDLDARVNDESKNLLRNLIDTSLMVQKAKDEDINVDTDVIKKLDQLRQMEKKATIEDFEKDAEDQGINWEDFKEQIHRQLMMQEIISREVGSRVVISRQEMLQYYDAHKSEFQSEGGVHLAEILISNTKHKGDEAEKRAKAAEAELKNGAKFSVIVKKYSDDPSADQSGDIGMMKTATLAPAISQAIAKLEVSDNSEPIPIKSGFIILRLLERFSPGIAPFDEVETHVNEAMFAQRMEPKLREYLTRLRKESYVYLAPGYIDTGAETPGAALTSEKDAMKPLYVKDLTPDTPVRSTFLVQSKECKIASTGAAYLDLTLQDTTGTISAKLWDFSERTSPSFQADDIIHVEGYVENYRGTAQLRIKKITPFPLEDVNLLDYLPRTRRDPEEMFAGLLDRVRKIEAGPLRTLLLSVLEDPVVAAKYKMAPAAMSYHHAFLGGLLEHVCSLLSLADGVADHYPWLRRDLIVAGIVLHDIGKVEELNFSRGFRYSTRGQLIGHISMGLEMVQVKIRQIPDFPAGLKNELEHIILSHHGKLEFGSPKEPMFAEAMVVSFLDEMDSKMEAVRAQYAADKNRPGDFTARNPALKRELLKPR